MPDATDLRALVFALATAHWREDNAALAALFYGGDEPVDERALLLAALDVIGELASIHACEEIPAVTVEDVLRRWCLEASTD